MSKDRQIHCWLFCRNVHVAQIQGGGSQSEEAEEELHSDEETIKIYPIAGSKRKSDLIEESQEEEEPEEEQEKSKKKPTTPPPKPKKAKKIVESFLRAEKINLVTFFQRYRQK